jgi:hypothetical protein
MTLADDLDAIRAMVSGEASPDDVGRKVLIELATHSEGPAGCAARQLLGGCPRDLAPESLHLDAKFVSMPNSTPMLRSRLLKTPVDSI